MKDTYTYISLITKLTKNDKDLNPPLSSSTQPFVSQQFTRLISDFSSIFRKEKRRKEKKKKRRKEKEKKNPIPSYFPERSLKILPSLDKYAWERPPRSDVRMAIERGGEHSKEGTALSSRCPSTFPRRQRSIRAANNIQSADSAGARARTSRERATGRASLSLSLSLDRAFPSQGCWPLPLPRLFPSLPTPLAPSSH